MEFAAHISNCFPSQTTVDNRTIEAMELEWTRRFDEARLICDVDLIAVINRRAARGRYIITGRADNGLDSKPWHAQDNTRRRRKVACRQSGTCYDRRRARPLSVRTSGGRAP